MKEPLSLSPIISHKPTLTQAVEEPDESTKEETTSGTSTPGILSMPEAYGPMVDYFGPSIGCACEDASINYPSVRSGKASIRRFAQRKHKRDRSPFRHPEFEPLYVTPLSSLSLKDYLDHTKSAAPYVVCGEAVPPIYASQNSNAGHTPSNADPALLSYTLMNTTDYEYSTVKSFKQIKDGVRQGGRDAEIKNMDTYEDIREHLYGSPKDQKRPERRQKKVKPKKNEKLRVRDYLQRLDLRNSGASTFSASEVRRPESLYKISSLISMAASIGSNLNLQSVFPVTVENIIKSIPKQVAEQSTSETLELTVPPNVSGDESTSDSGYVATGNGSASKNVLVEVNDLDANAKLDTVRIKAIDSHGNFVLQYEVNPEAFFPSEDHECNTITSTSGSVANLQDFLVEASASGATKLAYEINPKDHSPTNKP